LKLNGKGASINRNDREKNRGSDVANDSKLLLDLHPCPSLYPDNPHLLYITSPWQYCGKAPASLIGILETHRDIVRYGRIVLEWQSQTGLVASIVVRNMRTGVRNVETFNVCRQAGSLLMTPDSISHIVLALTITITSRHSACHHHTFMRRESLRRV